MAKAKRSFLVMHEKDGLFVPIYRGPDKKVARERAAKHLTENPKADVYVARVSAKTLLKDNDLKRHLPNDAF